MINYSVYENKSSSQWVTFVHGAGGSSSIWFRQIRDFHKQYNILLLDLRGHGNPVLKRFRLIEFDIPTLYIMGEEDYMFLPSVRKVVEQHHQSSQLVVIQQCGHVVNIEQSEILIGW